MIKELDVIGLLKNGYTHVEVQTVPEPAEVDQLPLKITPPGVTADDDIALGNNPSLLFVGRDGKARYVLVNGFIFDLDQDQDRIATLIKFL